MHSTIKLIALVALFSLPCQAWAQACSETDISVVSQAEINDFQSTFGPCDSISGSLTIEGPDITDLYGLNDLTSIGIDLNIQNNTILTSLAGLNVLTGVGNNVLVHQNPVLSACLALTALLDDIDDDLAGPGPGIASIPDVGADVNISSNAEGCNSIQDGILAPPEFDSSSCEEVAGTTHLHWEDEIGNYDFCSGVEFAFIQDLDLEAGTAILEGYDVSDSDCLANSIYTFSISEDGSTIDSVDLSGGQMTLTLEESQECFVGRWQLNGDSFLSHLWANALNNEFNADSCSEIAGTTNIHWQDMTGDSDFCGAVEYTILKDLDLAAGTATLEGFDVSDSDCLANAIYQFSFSEDGTRIVANDNFGGQMKLYRTGDQQCFVGRWNLDGENWLAHFPADALRDAHFEDGFEPQIPEQ